MSKKSKGTHEGTSTDRTSIEFMKYEGLLNDFVIVDDRSCELEEKFGYPEMARKMCPRKVGIGADGLIILRNSTSPEFDIRFLYFNPDGSEAEMCGNGVRCFTSFYNLKVHSDKRTLKVQTKGGLVVTYSEKPNSEMISVDLGLPKITSKYSKLEVLDREFNITTLYVGPPHCIVFIDKDEFGDLDDFDIRKYGKSFEYHKKFQPDRINVHFIQTVTEKKVIKMKTWERGAEETWCCGTGSAAAVVASFLNKWEVKDDEVRKCRVKQRGGNLDITWEKNDHLLKKGPSTFVFSGVIQMM